MEMHPVDSTSIAAIGYDEDSQTLQVEFVRGASYQYFDVPLQIFEGMRDAPSVGQYLNQQVRGVYRYSRV